MNVSVIIPTYNEQDDILKALNTLESQTLKNFEVIVVDDGSADKTYKLLKKFRTPHFSYRVYTQNHEGPAKARNKGALHSKGKILVFVDADMTFDKDFLKNLILPIEKNKAIGTFSKEEYISNWENVWSRCWNYNEGWEDKKRHQKNYPDTQKVFRAILKEKFDKAGGFDKGGYTDDYSLSDKLGQGAIVAKDAIFYHRNPDSLSEVFHHAKWVGKRKYKFGIIGYIVALIRSSLPVSIVNGIIGSLRYKTPQFLIFKIIYDLGCFIGVLQYALLSKGTK